MLFILTLLSLDQEVKMTKGKIDKLQKEYIDLSVCAAKEMVNNVAVENLQFLPPLSSV